MAAPFDFIEEAKHLIRFRSVTWDSNAQIAVYVGSLFRKVGLEVSYQEGRSLDGTLFMNVVGVTGKGKGPVLLTTHLDTVDPGNPRLWTKTGGDPFKLTRRGGSLYGLGVADTKLDLLCKLTALNRFRPHFFKRPIMILGSFGEESGLRGAARFCQGEFPKPRMALVGEPSQMRLVTRHKGLLVAEVLLKSKGLLRPPHTQWCYEAHFLGEAAHSSTPEMGHNAILESLRFLQKLHTKYKKVVVLSWQGGTGHNIIPASAALRFSLADHPKVSFPSGSRCRVKTHRLPAGWYSTLPWERVLWTWERFQELFRPYEKLRDREFDPAHLTWNVTRLQETKEGWSLVFDARPLPGQSLARAVKGLESKLWKEWGPPGPTWQFHLERDNSPLETSRQEAVVQLAMKALRQVKLSTTLVAKSGCSEAGLYAKVGIPSVVIGPGRSAGNIHRPNEQVPLKQLKKAIQFYEAFYKQACS